VILADFCNILADFNLELILHDFARFSRRGNDLVGGTDVGREYGFGRVLPIWQGVSIW